MAKCKDCLHYEACLTFSKFINAARDVEQGCEHFQDRTNCVEVVRCKDCKWWSADRCTNINGAGGYIPNGEWFCRGGERISK